MTTTHTAPPVAPDDTARPRRRPAPGPAARAGILLAACLLVALAAAVAQLLLGRSGMSATEAIAALAGNPERPAHALILKLRLPRILGALAAGAALGLAGALLRYVTANPLAEPGLLGISSGAALGVVGATALGIHGHSSTLPALLGALGTFALVLLAILGRATDRVRLVLSGVLIGSIVSALTAGVLAATGRPLGAVLRWLVGSLNPVTAADLRSAIIPASLGLILLAATGRRLGALRLPHTVATTIGARPELTRMLALGAAVALTTASVLIAGAVAFLGLAAPEIARRALGTSTPALLVPCAGAAGAAILACADALAVRATVTLPGVGESVTGLPVGALVAPVCVPFVLAAIVTRKRP